jgi:hypothetical protein
LRGAKVLVWAIETKTAVGLKKYVVFPGLTKREVMMGEARDVKIRKLRIMLVEE